MLRLDPKGLSIEFHLRFRRILLCRLRLHGRLRQALRRWATTTTNDCLEFRVGGIDLSVCGRMEAVRCV